MKKTNWKQTLSIIYASMLPLAALVESVNAVHPIGNADMITTILLAVAAFCSTILGGNTVKKLIDK